MLDLARTTLALLDLPVGADLRGRALVEFLEPTFWEHHPIREVPTHEEQGWLVARRARMGKAHAEDRERLEQLRRLGYVER